MTPSDQSLTERRKARRLRMVVFLFIGVIGGAVGGGFVLDESPPEVGDLALPTPSVGKVDPFAWFESDPPFAPLELESIAYTSGFPLDPRGSTLDQREEWAADERIIAARHRLREWSAAFEAEFGRSGGDPNRLPGGASAGEVPRILDWATLNELETVREFIILGDDLRPSPMTVGRLDPAPVDQTLLTGSRLEQTLGDWDQAFAYQSLALRIETWTLIYHRNPSPEGLQRVLETLYHHIAAGDLSRIESETVLDGLGSWELPTTTFEGASARFFRDRRAALEQEAHWRATLGEGPPAFRFKEQRTIRRLADQIRTVREKVHTPGVVGDAETSPLVRAWIDPYGDKLLQPELDYLDGLHEESFIAPWQQGKLIQWAIAIHRYERAHGAPPESLEVLIPAFLPTLPEIPGATVPPRYDPATRKLQFTVERTTRAITIPAI